MGSSIFCWISRRKAASNSPKFLRGVSDSPKISLLRGANSAINTLLRRVSNDVSSLKSSSRISLPLLMLPSGFKPWKDFDNITIHKLYSLAKEEVVNLCCKRVEILEGDVDIRFVSSSHGWITVFNRRNCGLFLVNPLSGRLIELPPIHTLDIPQANLKAGVRCVSKVITSCSPDQQDCRVMMSYGPYRALAFCTPTSATWTPIGYDYYRGNHDDDYPIQRGYHDFVYSTRDKLFYCIDTLMGFEAWDLEDTRSPMVCEFNPSMDDDNYPWPARSDEELELKISSSPFTFLVVAEECGDVFWVTRHIMPHMEPDGSYMDCSGMSDDLSYKTVSFDIHKYDMEKDELVYMDGKLDGLAIFIGNNHSFAISASEFPRLKPNSIYFTDINYLIPENRTCDYGWHDIGIFNYEDKTFSSCYYPNDADKIKIMPAPMWFTPTS